MNHSPAYYRVRTACRVAFWLAIGVAITYALQLFIICLWALQF